VGIKRAKRIKSKKIPLNSKYNHIYYFVQNGNVEDNKIFRREVIV